MAVCSPPLPIDRVYFIIGNDLAGGKVYPAPEVVTVPLAEHSSDEEGHVFGACALTQAQAQRRGNGMVLSESLFSTVFSDDSLPSTAAQEDSLHDSGVDVVLPPPQVLQDVKLQVNCEALIQAQKADSSVQSFFEAVLNEEDKLPVDKPMYRLDKGDAGEIYIWVFPRDKCPRLCHTV